MNENRIIEHFIEYAKIHSPSYKEGNMAKKLIEELKSLGLDVKTDNAGEIVGGNTGNIIAYLKGTLDGESIMFSSHMDTVVPCENIEPIIDGELIKSKGDTILSADDKAGIVAIVEAIRYIKENDIPHRDIEVVFTIGEEVALLGSEHLDYSKIKSKIAYVLDGEGHPGTITVKSPSHAFIEAKFIGVAKHAGLEPEKGISAIQMAADAISNMQLLRLDEESSANVGTIKGGMANNIVAKECIVTFEARSLSNEKNATQVQLMIDAINNAAKKFGGKVEIKSYIEYPAISLKEDEPVLSLLRSACDKCGFEYIPESSGGGADACNFYQHGISAATLGVGMQEVHSINEYIEKKDIIDSTKLVIALMTN